MLATFSPGPGRRKCTGSGSPLNGPGVALVFVAPFVFLVDFPAFGFFDIADFPLDVLEDLVLQGGESAIPLEHALVAGQQHVQADQLPLGDTFRFLDVREGVALEGLVTVGSDLAGRACL